MMVDNDGLNMRSRRVSMNVLGPTQYKKKEYEFVHLLFLVYERRIYSNVAALCIWKSKTERLEQFSIDDNPMYQILTFPNVFQPLLLQLQLLFPFLLPFPFVQWRHRDT